MNDYFGLPGKWNLGNFLTVLQKANYFKYLGNSLIITVFGAIGVFVVTPVTSFVIARRMSKYKYFKFLYYFIVFGMFVPFQAKMLALVQVLTFFHLMNTTGLILLYIVSGLCVNVMLMAGYIKKLPPDIEEAAIIDGCTRLGSIFKVVYPVAKPMIVAILIKDILWMWNDFLMPLIVLSGKPNQWTLQMFQYNFKSTYYTDYGVAYAAYLMSAIPIILVYIFASRQITEGLTVGSVKG
jgi:raffinose/stachyose/melibiose transport system permease protein